MSEYLLWRYRSIVDELLLEQRLEARDDVRQMLANTIMTYRVLPARANSAKAGATNSPIPALRVALTRTKALLRRSTLAQSVVGHSRHLVDALNANPLVPLELVLAVPGFDPTRLLQQLKVGKPSNVQLRRLLVTLQALDPENYTWKVGRPWALFTRVIRAGCIAWLRGGRLIASRWDVDNETLSGDLPDFLRSLIACCNGTHSIVRNSDKLFRVQQPKTGARGDSVVVHDTALRDGIRAFKAWCTKHQQKFEPFSLD